MAALRSMSAGVRRERLRRGSAYGAAALAVLSAGVSAYWTAGGTALLSTVGGELEALARRGGTTALTLGATTTALKLAAAALALALIQPWGRPLPRRLVTRTALLGAALLTAYGALQIGVGAIALVGLTGFRPADPTALRWHVLFWDPWFLLWGLLLGCAAVLSRSSAIATGVAGTTRPDRGGTTGPGRR
ncbi:DUF3995 domain-containing protein [Blastococcus sp. SYSU DS1024]